MARELGNKTPSTISLYCARIVITTLALVGVARASSCAKEKKGNIIIQTESIRPTAKWTLESDFSGYTGEGYLVWRGGDHYELADKRRGVLKYRICADGGDYKVNLWSLRVFEDGRREDEGNDCWINNGTTWIKIYTKFEERSNTWQWSYRFDLPDGEKIDPIITLPSGCTTLQLAARSANYAIDRIVLQRMGRGRASGGTTTPCDDDDGPATPPTSVDRYLPRCELGGLAPRRGPFRSVRVTNWRPYAIRVWRTGGDWTGGQPLSVRRIDPGVSRLLEFRTQDYVAITTGQGQCIFSERITEDTPSPLTFGRAP